jgi:hypothetical protein
MEAYFEVAELCELLATVVETAKVGFGLIVDNLVGTHVTTLGESLAADLAEIWAFSCVPSLVCLNS